ncbi:MAG: FAD-dependent oxidoreductase [Chloroflexota bacterium]
MKPAEVVVIGGGIAGCTIAFELARGGAQVRLLERRNLAYGASGRNLGLLLNDLSGEAIAMMREALETYRVLAAGPLDFELREVPYLLLPTTEEQAAAVGALEKEMRDSGFDCEPLPPDALVRQLPQLARPLAWALSAPAATHAVAEAARQAGAVVETGTNVSRLVSRAGRVEGVVTDAGIVACDAVVVANGPWLPDLVGGLALSTGRGWVLRTGRLDFALPWVLVDLSWPDLDELGRAARPPTLAEVAAGDYDRPAAATVSMIPVPDGSALLGTSLAPSLREPVEGVDMPKRIAQRAVDLLPGMGGMSINAGWYGMRPMTPDGLPVVGRTAVEGVYVHGGHGSIGMQSAPWTARLLAADMNGSPSPELAKFRPDRFQEPTGR